MSHSSTVLPAPSPRTGVDRVTAQLAERRMVSPARMAGYELRLVGATVLPQRQVIARTQWGTWLFVDHVDDPTASEYAGKVPIPADQHSRLLALERAGVAPDLVWLGHELPDYWKEGQPIPRLVPAPPRLREKDQRLTERLSVATEVFIKGAGATLAMAAAVPMLATGAVVGAISGLDPIVLGGVKHPEEPIVQWALLAQWTWE